MNRNAKNLMRLISLILAVLFLGSCSGCDFSALFDIVVPTETDENGNPITPDGSYTNSKGQSGLVDYSTDEPTEEPTEEIIISDVEYNEALELEIQMAHWDEFVGREKSKYESYHSVQYLGTYNGAQAVYILPNGGMGFIQSYYIRGYEFRTNGGRLVYMYKDKNFYTLEQALGNGMISSTDFEDIYNEFRSVNADNYKKIYDGYYGDKIYLDRITIKLQPQYNEKEYTIEDFTDVGAISLQHNHIAAQESNEVKRGYVIFFPETTYENLINLIRILEARDDIYQARPYSNQSMTLD